MRLWTLHPRHLDAAGLVALWREALLAQAVLLGRTRGYTRHPQLQRFQTAADPVASIASYLRAVADEATSRGYAFDATRIVATEQSVARIAETKGQLRYEWEHLGRKVQRRAPAWYHDRIAGAEPAAHPLFRIVAGGVRDWERVAESESERGSTRRRGAAVEAEPRDGSDRR
jgi:hypothetical protein